jgi:hypothetical protein
MTRILFSACEPVKVNPLFGAGISAEHTPGFADELLAAIGHPVPTRKWATDDEWRAHYLGETLSRDEYLALKAEAEAATLDRYSRADQAEADELGISPESMEALAEDAALLDRACGLPTPAAEAEVRRVEIRGAAYVAELIAPGEDNVAAVRLTKLADGGAVYDVARTRFGTVECTCADYTFRLAGTALRCKHGAALEAAGLLDPPAPARTPRRPRPQTMRQKRRAALKAAAPQGR